MSDYPNIEAIAAGTISGAFREWPRVREEAKALLRTVEDERKFRLQNAKYAAELEAEVERLRTAAQRCTEISTGLAAAGVVGHTNILDVMGEALRGGGE